VIAAGIGLEDRSRLLQEDQDFVFQLVPVVLLAERKILGRFQHRYGPNRVGPFGALQPIADIGKLVFKAQFRPAGANGSGDSD